MASTVAVKAGTASCEILIEADSVASVGDWAARSIGEPPRKVAVVSNRKIFGFHGDRVEAGLQAAGFATSVCLVGDGERFKSMTSLSRILHFLADHGFTRSDALLALGGGVVGDLAGFAASVYLRGIGFLQVPTSLLAMIDSSVGGKTGVNTPHGKNLVGTFYQPTGVLIDPLVLKTLPSRELTAGLFEAVKQAMLAGGSTFASVRGLLGDNAVGSFGERIGSPEITGRIEDFLSTQVSFKAKIVRGDEREDPLRTDAASRKILNLGHTLGHALEKVTRYRYLKHGEAVGHGILFAIEVSKKLEFLSQDEVDSLNDVVHRAGVLPSIAHLDPHEVLEALTYDKKVIGRSLQWVLLKGIGKPVIIPQENIPKSLLAASLRRLIRQ